MATFIGDLLRILAHTGLQTAGGMGRELMSSYLKPGAEAKEAYLKSLIPTIATAPEAQAESAAKTFEEATGQKQPRYLARGFTPEGVAPSPTSLMSLADVNKTGMGGYGAYDVGAAEKLVRPTSTLEQQAAAEATSAGISPLEILSRFKRLDQPRGEFATLADMALYHPNQTIRTAAKAKMEQPSEMMDFRKTQETQRVTDREQARTETMLRHQENLGLRQQIFQLQIQEATRRGDEAEQKSLGQVLTEHGKYIKSWEGRPVNEETILESGRSYNQAREAYAKRYPGNIGMLPPSHTEETAKTLFGRTEYQRPVAPSKKVPGATTGAPTPTTLTFPRRVKAGGQEIIVNSQEEYDELKRKYTK